MASYRISFIEPAGPHKGKRGRTTARDESAAAHFLQILQECGADQSAIKIVKIEGVPYRLADCLPLYGADGLGKPTH